MTKWGLFDKGGYLMKCVIDEVVGEREMLSDKAGYLILIRWVI